jgi:hypothetical protein
VEVVFVQVSADGGAAVDQYSIEMSTDGLIFVEVANQMTSPALVTNGDVTSGSYLTFRYRAHNVHGWSDYSDEAVILAATIPDPPTSLSSMSTFTATSLTLSWAVPVNTGGLGVVIDEYMISILSHDGVNYFDVPSSCDTTNPAVTSAASCQVEMV